MDIDRWVETHRTEKSGNVSTTEIANDTCAVSEPAVVNHSHWNSLIPSQMRDRGENPDGSFGTGV